MTLDARTMYEMAKNPQPSDPEVTEDIDLSRAPGPYQGYLGSLSRQSIPSPSDISNATQLLENEGYCVTRSNYGKLGGEIVLSDRNLRDRNDYMDPGYLVDFVKNEIIHGIGKEIINNPNFLEIKVRRDALFGGKTIRYGIRLLPFRDPYEHLSWEELGKMFEKDNRYV